jgi:enoyl-CoA hydratase/carnithine racemase
VKRIYFPEKFKPDIFEKEYPQGAVYALGFFDGVHIAHRALISEAKEKAESIIRMAENEAELEREKATDGIKKEIASVSSELAKKMLEREINNDDHRDLIDSFIEKIGDNND